MLTLAAAIFFSAPTCPAAFSLTNTTIGAISDSTSLSVCVAKAVLVTGSDGSLKLVINASQSAPKCLIYPIGLNPDLTFDLLTSGHTGCWSLYPPSQPVAIVNLGKPSQAKLTAAFKSFRPTQPLIFFQPSSNLKLGDQVKFSSSAKLEVIKCKIMNLPCQVRFRPISYTWNISGTKTKIVSPAVSAKVLGLNTVTLAVTFSLEYAFSGLTGWQRVYPNLLMNAPSRTFTVGMVSLPTNNRAPRLVNSICLLPSNWGC